MRRLAPALALAVIAVALLSSGCGFTRRGAGPRPGPPAARDRDKDAPADKGVTVEDDPKKSRIRFIGEKAQHGRGSTNVQLLRSWLDRKTGELSHQLYVTDRYLAPSARNWSGATGNKGERLRFTRIDAQVETCSPDGCPRMEAFGAGIDDATLRAAAKRGYEITFAAQDGSKESILVTTDQIRDQLEAIDRKTATLPPRSVKKPVVKKKPRVVVPKDDTVGGAPKNSGY